MRGLLLVVLLAAALSYAGTAAGATVFASNRSGTIELYTVGPDGVSRLTFNEIGERLPEWTRDGQRIAFAGLLDGNWDIYTIAADGTDLRRLTESPARDDRPKWTSDGRIVFQRGPLFCPCQAWIMDADGGSEALIPLRGNIAMPEPSPHGQRLAYSSDIADRGNSLWVAHINGKGARRITGVPPLGTGDFTPRWSPNGNDLAFLRGDVLFTENDLYVVHTDGTGLRRLTDTPGRSEGSPTWSRDGGEIVFTTPAVQGPTAQRLLSVSLADGTERAVATSPRAPWRDSFDDGLFDASVWHQIVTGTETSIAEIGGRVEVSIGAGAVPGGPFDAIDAHYGSQCSLPGDYDYQVRYELLEWPAANGVQTAINAFFADSSAWRGSNVWGESYAGFVPPSSFASIPTIDLAGTLRLTREAGVARSLFWDGGRWTPLVTAASVGDAVYGFAASSFGGAFGGRTVRVAFDDFRLNSGALSCPSWWIDREADVH